VTASFRRAAIVVIITTWGMPVAQCSLPTPFLVAARSADSVVRVELIRLENGAPLLKVLEVLRGKPSTTVLVSSCIWDAITIGRKAPPDATYLLLLRGTEEIMCGHVNGLATISGGCIGLLPVVDGVVPKEFAAGYDGVSDQAVPLARVRHDVQPRRGG
jgi:hypothetical protein